METAAETAVILAAQQLVQNLVVILAAHQLAHNLATHAAHNLAACLLVDADNLA